MRCAHHADDAQCSMLPFLVFQLLPDYNKIKVGWTLESMTQLLGQLVQQFQARRDRSMHFDQEKSRGRSPFRGDFYNEEDDFYVHVNYETRRLWFT